jgi:hypothetical protein
VIDVFFQVPNDNKTGGTDYVVSFAGTTFVAYEKPTAGPASPLNPDGSFNLNSPVWTLLTPDDLARAQFQTAIGFGYDPATPSVPDHLLAEFQLTIQSPNAPLGGFYDPAPAFWSASVSGSSVSAAADPPISSGIFQLNPDGTTVVTPVFAANGGPPCSPRTWSPSPRAWPSPGPAWRSSRRPGAGAAGARWPEAFSDPGRDAARGREDVSRRQPPNLRPRRSRHPRHPPGQWPSRSDSSRKRL